jgi:hypothetical protein
MADDPTPEPDPEPDPGPDPEPTPEPEPDPKPDPDDKIDWKREARKHEARAKKAAAERDAHAAKIAEIEASKMSDQDKAIATAREEAKAEAEAEAAKTRRGDKLELAVARLAGVKGVTVGAGDKAKTVRFADPDDVQMWLERQIAKGDIDADDIYKDGKVAEDVLTDALADLAASKPGWLVGATAPASGTPAGSVDAGAGAPRKGTGSVEDELRQITQHTKR